MSLTAEIVLLLLISKRSNRLRKCLDIGHKHCLVHQDCNAAGLRSAY